jgi:hypothetical protein
VKRPSEISLRLRFSTKQNHGERLLPGNLAGEADRLVLAALRHPRSAEFDPELTVSRYRAKR